MASAGIQDRTEVLESYLDQFGRQPAAPAWLADLRRSGFERFAALGFPHHKQEGWRQTNLAPVAQSVFSPVADGGVSADTLARLRALALPGVDWSPAAPRLVFVNGHFSAALSHCDRLPAGVRVSPLRPLLREAANAARLQAWFAAEGDFQEQALVALNYAFLADGAWIEIGADTTLEEPIGVVYFTTQAASGPGIAFPHTAIHLGPNARARVVETFAGVDGEVYFNDPVTEAVLSEGARLEHVRIEQESRSAWHVSKLRSRQARNSRLRAHAICLGGALVRNNVHAILDGEGGECLLNGLLAIDGNQHVDNNTVLDHAQPLCNSREYYKGVLDGRANGVFNGRIVVRPGAQHTDAIQSNKNLLLSRSAAQVSSQPQLEIYADDVRCTHGATVGQLDDEALFYLRSRALGIEESRRLLIYAFAADVLARIEAPGLRERLEAMLFARWAQAGSSAA